MGGAQSLGHAARAALAAWMVLSCSSWTGRIFICVQVHMWRGSILQAVATNLPALLPFVKLIYRFPADLHIQGAPRPRQYAHKQV